eukprot:TRINITY_DN39834_c0_g1_i1.p2 TRINITY_DN39834_c0_g1~~TRINITY_DN39834_c0_g1_i1.p2  ORF type:complete len:335 (+),score=76.40 TRINITY_DN39834_c0_g1_i1:47-1051(+)
MASTRKRPSSGNSNAVPQGGFAATLVQLFAREAKRPCIAERGLVVLSDSDNEAEPKAAEQTLLEHPRSVERGDSVDGKSPVEMSENASEDQGALDADVMDLATVDGECGSENEDRCESLPAIISAEGLFEEFSFGMPATPMQAFSRGSASSSSTASASRPEMTAGHGSASGSKGRKADRKAEKEQEDFSALSAEERSRISEKWRGLTGQATKPQDIRLQLLVAAILHPKAPEKKVQVCMTRLRTWAAAAEGALSPSLLAATSPEQIEEMLQGLHWSKTKSQRLAAAASMLVEKWNGQVPSRQGHLQTLPGIGPKLGALLEFVIGALAPLDETDC